MFPKGGTAPVPGGNGVCKHLLDFYNMPSTMLDIFGFFYSLNKYLLTICQTLYMNKLHSQTLKAKTAMSHAMTGVIWGRLWECPTGHPTSLGGQRRLPNRSIISRYEGSQGNIYRAKEIHKERVFQAEVTVCARPQKQRQWGFHETEIRYEWPWSAENKKMWWALSCTI